MLHRLLKASEKYNVPGAQIIVIVNVERVADYTFRRVVIAKVAILLFTSVMRFSRSRLQLATEAG